MSALADAAMEVATPAFVVDLGALHDQASRFHERASEAGVKVCVAVKASRDPQVLRTLARIGFGADVASRAELEHATAASLAPVVATAPGLEAPTLQALHAADARIFFDHIGQLDALGIADPLTGRHGVRLSLSGAYAHFGLSRAELARLLADGHRVRRVHAHGGELLTPEHVAERLRQIDAVTNELALELVDVGGGFGVLSNVATQLDAAFATLARYRRARSVDLVMEPGKALVARCSVLVASVLAVKRRDDQDIAIVDASSFNLGELERRQLWTTSSTSRDAVRTRIQGPTCFEGDSFGSWTLPRLRTGDRVVFAAAGAYLASVAGSLHELPVPRTVYISRLSD
jgi:diaminopimelate decarboxylase